MTTETHAIIITIVGASELGTAFGDELHALNAELSALLPRIMPSFVFAHPPATVITHELLAAPVERRVAPAVQTAENDIITAARKVKKTLRGDGNGRVWCDAKAADELASAIERWERFPEG
jgi:hypothetical protein